MAFALLDINDCELRLWTPQGSVTSPGYALLEGRDYRFGETARGAARLHPHDINNRFWWQLDTAPLRPALGPARHSADLVHGHLLELHRQAGQPAQIVVACPGSLRREQLSLLLGIARQCPFTITGLVDRSALITSARPAGYHLELQLHQALLTELAHSDGAIGVVRSTPLPGCGWLQIQERLADQVAAAFIRQTRFDPRRRADSEQALYDALPGVLVALDSHSEYNLELEGHRARLSRTELAAACERLVSALAGALTRGASSSLLVDPLPAALPGLAEALPGMQAAPGDAAWRAATAHQGVFGDTAELHFIDSLPLLGAAAAPAASPALAVSTPPTHLLQGALASPLGTGPVPLDEGVELHLQGAQWQLGAGAEINGLPAPAGQVVQAGDVIRVRGAEYRLITVRGAES